MATTTNYGWGTPDDTDLVKDGALAIRDLGQDIDTTTKALNPETTTGDIAYRSATANTNTRLALGTAGQVLTVNSGATAPEWASPAGGGKVLQVIQATYSTSTTIASTTFTDTGLSATITPSSATSKILVLVNQSAYIGRSSSQHGYGLRILRASTDIFTFPSQYARFIAVQGAGEVYNGGIDALTYLDSPATTSATTYKTQAKSETTANSGTFIAQISSTPSVITLIEIGA